MSSSSRHRATKIVATLGGASSDADMLRALFDAGADVFRLNFSHGTQAEQGERIDLVDANAEASLGHIGEAHEQILKYQKHMRGNRGLILKVFGVLFFVVIVYGTLYR